ncbi:cupin domain-containing protein [Intestinibaculum porci]|jgi:quercetin dioxygenase-like cupin family protein|uniref:Cupin n=1 Tax=Intestinibaculum porci TaxID=2487118 RepID=A0A3G9JTB3_9FIRM|nr:cupin domain-containing protein [Intestinibaculum porci]MDD6349808.1 cupin domain-containing protein [Intestinibaculum porci]MDD6421689.1 cupin domain-containing protein [Intestinibaculum porci]BBH26409.1 cupin [Intestinibaculum porci]
MPFVRHQQQPIVLEHFQGGEGEMLRENILNTNEEMYDKGRVFAKMTLKKGCEVGRHTHHGDSETMYILKGHGKYLIDGQFVDVGPGDTLYCGAEEEHMLRNENDEPLEFIALVLFK